MKLDEEDFNTIYDILQFHKVLMVVLDRESIKFSNLDELLDGMHALDEMTIKYWFS